MSDWRPKMSDKPKLPKEVQEFWTSALRSGKYKQGRLWLRRNGEHCCLGVLAEALGHDVSDGNTHYTCLPESRKDVREWLFSAVNEGMDIETYLQELNDTGALNFSEIADKIDELCGE